MNEYEYEYEEKRVLSVNRWRLVLGSYSDKSLDFQGNERQLKGFADMEELLDYLYGHAQGDDVRENGGRYGGSGDSVLAAVEWITKVRELFPKKTAEVLERHALDEFKMTELLTDKKILEQMKPDMQLLKTILQLKHLMTGDVLDSARRIAKQVADELRERLETDVRRSFSGKLDRSSQSAVHSARNLDIKKTIRRNLKNYDKEREQLILKDIYFSNRLKKYNRKTIIIAIDESGSMLDSVIYSAVMAQIISKLPFAEVKLVIFDTNVVDLTSEAEDPVQILMSIQLGGGTNIGGALAYCETLISTPRDTVVLCVTDLYECFPESFLLNTVRNIMLSGAKISFLTALDDKADPAYDKRLGQQLADMGAFVGAVTPDALGDYVGELFGD